MTSKAEFERQVRADIATHFAREYDRGATDRQIAAHSGYTIRKVRRLLRGAGIEIADEAWGVRA